MGGNYKNTLLSVDLMHDSCEGINAGNDSGIVTGRVSIPSKNDIWENKRHMQVGPTDYM